MNDNETYYPDEIIRKNQEKMNNIKRAFETTGIFPNRDNPIKSLSLRDELVLKMTFSLRIAFLEQMQFLFAFIFTKTALEESIKSLEKMGYIESSISRDYGKYFWLTTTAIYYFHTDGSKRDNLQQHISADKPPAESKLVLYKEQNGLFANMVFTLLLNKLFKLYSSQPVRYKELYQKRVFLQQIIYPQREKISFSKKKCETYITENLDKIESDYMDEYKQYLKKLKKALNDPVFLFHFLKDFYNSDECLNLKLNSVNLTKQAIELIFNNVFRDRTYYYRKELYEMSNNSEAILNEWKLYIVIWQKTTLTIARRNLINTNLNQKDAVLLKSLNEKITQIDERIASLAKMEHDLDDLFQVLVVDNSDEETTAFKSSRVTLENLKNSNIYITNAYKQENNRYNLTFSVFQSSVDEMSCSTLFSKLEKIYHFARKNLLLVDYNIQIVTYSPVQKKLIEDKLILVEQKFADITSYALFLPVFSEITVVSTEGHFPERFEVFKPFKEST